MYCIKKKLFNFKKTFYYLLLFRVIKKVEFYYYLAKKDFYKFNSKWLEPQKRDDL